MADRNRGRSVDDDDPIDEVEDAYDDADLDDGDEVDDELDEESKGVPARRARAGAATRERTERRSRTRRDEAKLGLVGRLVRRFRETVAELQKVIWPTRKELLTYTTVVVVFVTLVMSYVAGMDVLFAKLMFLLFGKSS